MAYSTPDSLITTNPVSTDNYTNKIRASIIANSHAVFPLGGSRAIAIPTGLGYQDAPDYIEFEVPTTSYTGYVYKALIEIRTENASTTVTPKIRNVTDSTDAVVGSAGTATAWGTYQSLTFTVAAGKKYRLMASKANDTYQSWVIGVVQRTHA